MRQWSGRQDCGCPYRSAGRRLISAEPSIPPTPEVARAEAQELRLLARLRAGDEAAFGELVDRMTPSLLRVARSHVPSQAVAEEVVQETWLGVLSGIDRFEGRSTVRTWVFRILLNQARTRGERERRTVPFATLAGEEASEPFHAVDPSRFRPASNPYPGHWASPLERWEESPERSLESRETMALIRAAIEELPPMQRLVITMRDVEGWSSTEVCDVLTIEEGNQRVLLHRARSRVRSALEAQFTA